MKKLPLIATVGWVGMTAATTAFAGAHHPTVLHEFSADEGIDPRGSLVVGPDGALYGDTYWGGSHPDETGGGTLYRQKPNGQFSVLQVFQGKKDGPHPNSSLVLGPDGRLWGTTAQGGPDNQGVVFAVDTHGHLQVHHAFDWTNGGFAYPGVTFGQDGMVYGATTGGGANEFGTIYRLDPSTDTFTILHAFEGGAAGEEPYATPMQASDGNLYGTTYQKGGVLYRLTPAGDYTVLHHFSGADGCGPIGPLVQGPDGRLYGTANACGGDSKVGTIFAMGLDASFQALYEFKLGCGVPWQGLSVGPDGRLYGTAEFGGEANSGCAYAITTDGQFTFLYKFTAADGGYGPRAGITFIGSKMYGASGTATYRLDKGAAD